MHPTSYTLTTNGMHVHAVIAWDSFARRGDLFVSYDDNRCVALRLGYQEPFLREDAIRALTSRRSLAAMQEQSTYCHKATCRAVTNRLALMVERGVTSEAEVCVLLDNVAVRWNSLKTEHDFVAFVSSVPIGEYLKLCRRTSEDFARIVAPALCDVIKADVKERPRLVEDQTLELFRGLLQQHGRPTGSLAGEVFDHVNALVVDLRAQADASLQAGTLDTLVTAALERRGVPTIEGFGPAVKVRALIEYLGAVEAAAEQWQKAGKRWQKCVRGDALRDDRYVFANMPWGPAAVRQVEARGADWLRAPLVLPPGAVKVEKDETGLFTATVEKAGADTCLEVPFVTHKHDSEEPTC